MASRGAASQQTSQEKRAARAKALQRHRDALDDYLESVRGLYALAISASWDDAGKAVRPDARWCVPRRMDHPGDPGDPSATPPRRPVARGEVTPDAVVQVTAEYGLVAEMKKHFSTSRPGEVFEQVAKYDADLEGWWTHDGHIASHDLVLLTHLKSSVAAVDAFKAWQAEGNAFRRPFSIVEFAYMTTGSLWFLLRRVEGQVSDPVHDEALRKGKMISDSNLLSLFSKWKFSEQQPPIMHMLVLLHDYVLPLFPTEMEFERETGGRYPVIEVSCEELREKLSEQFCPLRADDRYFHLPKLPWVRTAIDQLVRIGLATRLPAESKSAPDTGAGGGLATSGPSTGRGSAEPRYRIALRKPRQKDTIEYFSDKLLQADLNAVRRKPPEQPTLFDAPTNATT